MARGERFGKRYNIDDLNLDLDTANFPGIELPFCQGNGAVFTPYEFKWGLGSEMIATPEQIGKLAHEIVDSIGNSNSYFHLKANGITFIIILHDPAHTGSLLVGAHPFNNTDEVVAFKDEANGVLRNVVRSFQRQTKKPLLY